MLLEADGEPRVEVRVSYERSDPRRIWERNEGRGRRWAGGTPYGVLEMTHVSEFVPLIGKRAQVTDSFVHLGGE